MHALSPTDSAFLWMETRNQPMHVAGLNLYTPPKGANADFVSKLLTRWGKKLQAQAPFNLRPVLHLGLWHWEEDKAFELDYQRLRRPARLRLHRLPSIGSRAATHASLHRQIDCGTGAGLGGP